MLEVLVLGWFPWDGPKAGVEIKPRRRHKKGERYSFVGPLAQLRKKSLAGEEHASTGGRIICVAIFSISNDEPKLELHNEAFASAESVCFEQGLYVLWKTDGLT